MDNLSSIHAGRLRAAERELSALLGQITAIGRDGANPNGSGPPYTPLPASDWAALAEALAALAAAAREVGALAGSPGPGAVHGINATRAALSARLAHVEDTLRDLGPDRLQARYGELPETAVQELQRLCLTMEQQVASARRALGPVPERR
jgi:hypothetical protein